VSNILISVATLSGNQIDNKENDLSLLLRKVVDEYHRNLGSGSIEVMLLVDEDAKILATTSLCDMGTSIYDLGVLSAALFGIAAEGQERFGCEDFNTCLMTWKDRQIFAQSIGTVRVETENAKGGDNVADKRQKKERNLILAAFTDERVNIGLMRVKMKEVAGEVLKLVSKSQPSMRLLRAKEEEIEELVKALAGETTIN
jgi:predicted regulator of Ras-like GTPase activity (Roadblock/LC7/MglB family)